MHCPLFIAPYKLYIPGQPHISAYLMSDIENHDDHYARSSYERLILLQPHIEFGGLWFGGNRYYIHCPTLISSQWKVEGKPLADWFDHSCKTITSPVTVVDILPEDCLPVQERTVKELVLLHGEPLTIVDIFNELIATLPKAFPLFFISSPDLELYFHTEIELTDEQKNLVSIACSNIKISMQINFVVSDENIEITSANKIFTKTADSLSLTSSRYVSNNAILSKIRLACEEDEEYWIDHRVPVFTDTRISTGGLLPNRFNESTSACYLNASVHEPSNIRSFLPLYRRIIIDMPLEGNLDRALGSFQVTESELVELACRGRVQFVLPQSLDRYPQSFLDTLLEASPESMLFSRRLALASIAETRKRVPLLYPKFGTKERRVILDLLGDIAKRTSNDLMFQVQSQLGKMWSGMERNIFSRGAMGTLSHGVGPILGELCKAVSGKDVRLEIGAAAMSVEWAATLGATYFPVSTEEYSEYGAAAMCATLYSGVNTAVSVNPVGNIEVLMNGLLTLDNDAPVLEVEKTFTHSDIDRLSKLVSKYAGTADAEEKIIEVVDSLNNDIQSYESHTERLNRYDIFGLGGVLGIGITGMAVGTPASGFVASLGFWLANYILKTADPSRDPGGIVLDWLRAKNAWTTNDVVLLSRLRSKIK